METKKFFETSWNTEYEKFQNDPQYAHSKTIRELNDLVRRVIGEGWCGSFVFEIADIHSASGNDAFLLREQDGKIHISGPSGVALASGLNYYLKCFAKVNFNPIFGGNVKMPRELPHLPGDIRRETNYAVRYALNFCTYGYTMAFWGWKEYEAFLDWLAMNGVNLMLDIAGQEEVQRRLLRAYGYTEKEIRAYIPGPAYLPWFFMQNMSGFGGPLPDSWFAQRVDLGRRIHDRMQALGITPVLQGYAGMVPTDFGSKHPDAAVLDQGLWCGFPRPSMLKTQASKGKDYFGEAADLFYAKQREVFGSITHYYAVDPFHEGGNMGDMTPALVYHRVQEKMLENDPEAIWLLMQWQGQLNDEKLCNLAAPGQALILDVQADRRPYSDLMERQHIPWLWSMVHNFGGRMGVDGDAVTLAHEIPETFRRSRHMTGIAAAPEALINGPLVYDLLFDMTWENGPVDVDAYVQKYAQSRYGGSNEHIAKAWDILLHTAYWKKTIYTQGAGECVINARPSEVFRSASTWGHKTLEYDQVQFEQALPELLAAFDEFGDCEAFRYDVVDVAKQVLSNRANLLHEQMMDNYHAGDLEGFRTVSKTFLELIKLRIGFFAAVLPSAWNHGWMMPETVCRGPAKPSRTCWNSTPVP